MPNHQLKYFPRDSWNGPEGVRTINIGEDFPGLDSVLATSSAKRGVLLAPGRNFRAVSIDAWQQYQIGLRHIFEDSDTFLQLTAFLAEADAGVQFEFMYDNSKAFADILTVAATEQKIQLDVASTTGLTAGDWVKIRAEWRRSVWAYYKIKTVDSGTQFTIEEGVGGIQGVGFIFTIGSRVTHRDYVPNCALLSHSLRKRRGGQAGADVWDFSMKFREID